MNWTQKIKAGSLQFVLFIGVVIALLLLTFVMLSHTHSLFGKKTERFVNTIKMADIGLAYALNNPLTPYDSIAIDPQIESPIELKAIKEYWGVFEKYTIAATNHKNRFVKSFLVGSKQTGESTALYLQDNQRPMIIAGTAQIKGDALLPQQGIRPGNIAGNSFYGRTPVQGRHRQSNAQLPALDEQLLRHLIALSRNSTLGTSSASLTLKPGLVAHNSFQRPTQVINGNVVHLSAITLSGNIVIRATDRIVVDASANLQDVVLMAPEISIKDGVIGTFQALASKNIEMGKRCHLAYPSALVVNSANYPEVTSGTNPKADINIGKNSQIKGIVMFLGGSLEKQFFHPQIKMDTGSQLWGEVYCEKNLELKGAVYGSVITHSFIALESGSIYQNHLYNGVIDITGRADQYSGLAFQGGAQQKTTVKWLY